MKTLSWTVRLVVVSGMVAVAVEGTNAPPAELRPTTPALPFPEWDKLPVIEKMDPLVRFDGTPVKTKEDWSARRKELIELAQHYIYGSCAPERLLPGTPPPRVAFEDKETLAKEGVLWKGIDIPLAPADSNAVVFFDLFLPAEGKRPFVTIASFGGKGRKSKTRPSDADSIALFISRGYAYAHMSVHAGGKPMYQYYFPEHSGPWVEGPPYAAAGVKALPHGWGAMSAWGWRLRRMIDALRTLPDVDPDRIIASGGSRWGMPAVMSAAIDQRIAGVICWQGIHEWRPLDAKKYGTTITGKPHSWDWFAGVIKAFQDQGRLDALPASAYGVLAAVAPRPALICTTVGYGGLVPSPDSYNAVEKALPVYRFLGAEVEMPEKPETLGVGLHGKGPLRLHLANKGHTVDLEDWKAWLDFLDEYFKPATARESGKN